jgi:hypothetical protein
MYFAAWSVSRVPLSDRTRAAGLKTERPRYWSVWATNWPMRLALAIKVPVKPFAGK